MLLQMKAVFSNILKLYYLTAQFMVSQCISSELCNWYQEKGILGNCI